MRTDRVRAPYRAEFARAHGWSVRATDSATGGTRFELSGIEPDTER